MGHRQQPATHSANHSLRWPRVAACIATALAAVNVQSVDNAGISADHRSLAAFTAPFRSATLAADQPGRIAALPIEEGQSVAAGALLVRIADETQRARTEMARQQAESMLDVQLAEIRHNRAVRELNRLMNLKDESMASEKEINDARAEADLERVSLDLARFNHAQYQLDYEYQAAALELLHIRAPFDGYLSQRLKEVGETAEEGEAIAVLVQLDPLLVTVDCPISQVGDVKVGDCVPVRPVDARWEPRVGEVTYVGRAADAASQTLRIKLLIDNHERDWLSGMKVMVDFDAAESPTQAAESDQPSFGRIDTIASPKVCIRTKD